MTKTYIKFRSRITVISCVVILSWAGLTARLFHIQVLNGELYRTQGIKQGQTQKYLPAVRGNIYDRNNTPLTRNIIHYTLAAHPSKIENKILLATAIHNCTNRPLEYYLEKLNSGKSFVYLERNLRKETLVNFPEENIDGLIIERNSRRYYPHDNIAGQIIGFTDVDDRGITGIEKRFDQYLRGIPGWIVKQRNGLGSLNPKNSFPTKHPVDGSNIQLTIDLEYQSILQEELLEQMKKTNAIGATGILMDPNTGAILAMSSIPDYNPNNPGNFKTEYQKIKSITDQFEPGSTFKIVAATASLELQTVNTNQEFNCEYGSYFYKDLRINDHEEFGLLTFSQIIEHSSNVGIIKISETIGQNNLFRFARNYGFGSLTNISLMGEVPGTLRKVNDWSDISLAEVSMGHEVGVTALQLATAYSAIANGGFLIKPRIVQQVIDIDGNIIYSERPEVIRKVSTKAVMSELKKMLARVVEGGTGTQARIPGWNVAGKTGTAQKFINGRYSKSKFISNFVGFFPAESPQILGVVILDEPQYGYHWGGIGAAPTFKKIIQRIINMDDSIQLQPKARKRNEPKPVILVNANLPDVATDQIEPLQLSVNQYVNPDNVIVPELRGMSLRKAINILHKLGLKPKLNGSGKVTWQSPNPGTNVYPGSICTIGLK